MAYSETPRIQPIVPAFHLKILSDTQTNTLKTAALEILNRAGIHCPSQKGLDIYAAHGALVDFKKQIVRLPADVVLEALSHAPRHYTMGARLPEHDLKLDGKSMYVATDGCGIEVIDFNTRARRNSRKEDVAGMARISDYLSSVGFYWPMVSAQDYPETAPLHELEASFNNTVKHVQTETVMGEDTARYAVEVARVIAENESDMRARPPLSSLVCCIAPLAQDKEGIESALVFAEAGLPVGFMSMANTGATAPATLAGTIVGGDAEILAALVLIQMAHPGAPVFYSLMPGIMQPRTGAFLTTPWENELSYAIGVEMAHAWGVPALAGIFGTDATVPGWQAGEESVTSLMLCALCGAETGSGMGLLETCTLLYPEELVLDSDVYHRVRISLSGLELDPDSLALDVIEKVGPRGHFLAQRHTREHIRERQFSSLTAQPEKDGGYRDPVAVAQEKVNWILENHHPQPLEASQQNELKRILKAAEKNLVHH
jgi:trimethylamine--corrinoid protein Co-methyltransferase